MHSFFTVVILVILTSHTSSETLFSAEDACDIGSDFNEHPYDLIVLMDASCPITEEQCKQQQLQTAETVMAIKSDDVIQIDDKIYSTVRVTYTEFNANDNINLIIGGFHDPINMNVIEPDQSRVQLYTTIKNSSICSEDNLSPTIRTGEPNLELAITRALDNINNFNFPPNTGRDRKILIVSNCGINDEQKNRVCEQHETEIITGGVNGFGINVIMINNVFIADRFINPNQYIMCLVEYEETRIHVNQPDTNYIQDVLPMVQSEICEMRTPAPTADPTQLGDTISPTSQTGSPTSKPTKNPTTAPTTGEPTVSPSDIPTTTEPTIDPTTDNPTPDPTNASKNLPTRSPHINTGTDEHTIPPTYNPSESPTAHVQGTVPLIVEPVVGPETTLWLWILIGALSCCCCGFIVFVILKRKKKKEEKRGYGSVAGHPAVDHQVSLSESDAVNNDELEHLTVS